MCVCKLGAGPLRIGVGELLLGLDTFRTLNEQDVYCTVLDLGAALGF